MARAEAKQYARRVAYAFGNQPPYCTTFAERRGLLMKMESRMQGWLKRSKGLLLQPGVHGMAKSPDRAKESPRYSRVRSKEE